MILHIYLLLRSPRMRGSVKLPTGTRWPLQIPLPRCFPEKEFNVQKRFKNYFHFPKKNLSLTEFLFYQSHLNECFLLSTEALWIFSLAAVKDKLMDEMCIKSSSLPGWPCSLFLHYNGDLGSGGARALI